MVTYGITDDEPDPEALIAEHRSRPACRTAPRRRSAPTTSAACCARPRCSGAREDAAAGRITAEERRAVEDRAIADVVRMQEDVGLQSATDGEFRRTSWHMDFIYQLGGVHPGDEKLKVAFRDEHGELSFEAPALVVDERISLPRADLRRRLHRPRRRWRRRRRRS